MWISFEFNVDNFFYLLTKSATCHNSTEHHDFQTLLVHNYCLIYTQLTFEPLHHRYPQKLAINLKPTHTLNKITFCSA